MSSLIQGYNYDIFISYRQKDNKHDGWVSEFVENLKGELESTFKEEISIYFDINPHDGLLETHDVDESLKEKLKCLIFIPVISRTYCDPRSFAWEHEFKAFIELASKDQFGLKVKLPNGNVASRIMPVRIHDLDDSDIKMFEEATGSKMRTSDFIFSTTSGVNRPLKANEDHPYDNLNKTYYRDQINKVALAIREIINAIGSHEPKPEKELKGRIDTVPAPPGRNRTIKTIIGSALAVALLILAFLIIPKLIGPSEQPEKSIAVLPFINDSPDEENTYFINGIMDEVNNNLQKIKDFRVVSRTSGEKYRGAAKSTIPEIAKDLDVNYIVEGSGQKYGNAFRLRVQLIAVRNEKHLWAESYQQEIKDPGDIFKIQSEIAKSIVEELQATITPDEERLIEKIPTKSLTAYDFYQRGREEYMKAMWVEWRNKEGITKSEYLFREALKYDSTFAPAYCWLASVYQQKYLWESYLSKNINILDSVLILANTAISLDDQLSDGYTVRGDYYRTMENTSQAEADYDRAIKLNPNDAMAYAGKGTLFMNVDNIKSLENFFRAASLYRGNLLQALFKVIGMVFMSSGFTDKAVQYFNEAFKLDGDSITHYYVMASLAFCTENFKRAVEYLDRAYKMYPENNTLLWNLGLYNMFAGQPEESLKFFKGLDSGDILTEGILFGSHRIGWAYWMNGEKEKAEYYFNEQIRYCNQMKEQGRVYGNNSRIFYDLAAVYAFLGERDKAYENLRSIDLDDFVAGLWTLSLVRHDPLLNSLRNDREFQQILLDVQTKYEEDHEKLRKWLEENKML